MKAVENYLNVIDSSVVRGHQQNSCRFSLRWVRIFLPTPQKIVVWNLCYFVLSLLTQLVIFVVLVNNPTLLFKRDARLICKCVLIISIYEFKIDFLSCLIRTLNYNLLNFSWKFKFEILQFMNLLLFTWLFQILFQKDRHVKKIENS